MKIEGDKPDDRTEFIEGVRRVARDSGERIAYCFFPNDLPPNLWYEIVPGGVMFIEGTGILPMPAHVSYVRTK